MSRTKLIIAVVALVAVVGGGWLLLGSPGVPGTSEPSPTLGPVPESTSLAADARAVPMLRAELAAPGGGGVVAQVLVSEGDEVNAGEALVAVEGSGLEAEVDAAGAAVAAAEAGVAQAQAAARQAAAQVTAADETVDQTRAALDAADAARDGTPSGGSARRAADAEVDRARAAVRAARAQALAARSAHEGAQATVAAAEAEVARAKAGLEGAKAALDELVLVTPISGTVVSLDAVVGEMLSPGAPVVRIADLDDWRFETIDLDEGSIGRIEVGAGAVVSVDAFAGVDIPARVRSIDRFGEASAGDIVYTVVLEPTGDVPNGLRWNMTASARIDTAR